MRVARLRRTVLSLLGVSTAFVVYAFCIVPFIEPREQPDGHSAETQVDMSSTSTDQYVRELTPLFPEGSWELDQPKVLRSEQATILLQEFEELDDGRLHVRPCTIVLYGSNRNAKDGGPTIMQAPQGAKIAFDEPLNLSSRLPGKPVSAQLVGGIRIVRVGSKDTEDLELVTSNVVISSKQIWTPDQVSFRLGNTYGTGSNLLITRASDEKESKSNSLLDDLGTIELQQLQRLSFRMEQDDLFDSFTNPESGPKPPDSQNQAVTPTKVEVRCRGRMIMDIGQMKATLEDNVTITRQQSKEQPDTLTASNLSMYFARTESDDSKPDPTASSSTNSAKPNTGLEITRLVAEGKPLVIDARSKQAYLECKRLEYDFVTRNFKLFGGNPFASRQPPAETADQVQLRSPQYQLSAPSIEFQNHADRAKWEVHAEGAGSFVGSLDGRSQVKARWSRGLSMTPVHDQQVLQLAGNATVEAPNVGSISAEKINLWLRQVSKQISTRLDGTPVFETTAIPMKLVTQPRIGQTMEIDAAQLSGSLAGMEIIFQRNPTPPPAPQPLSNQSDRFPSASASRPSRAAEVATTPKSKYKINGGELTAWVDPDTQQVHRMIVRGQSRIVEETKLGRRPFQLNGNAIDLKLTRGVPVVQLAGHPASISSPELDAVGNSIEFDGAQNVIRIPGAGSLTIQATNDFWGRAAKLPRSESSTPLSRPDLQRPTVLQPIDIEWQQGLHFDGRIVSVSGGVHATGEDLSFATAEVKITLDRNIDLSDPKSGKVRPELKFVSARGGVTAAVRSRDELNNPKSFQQVAAQDLDVDFETGDVTANGPGRLSFTSADKLMPSMGAEPTQTSERSAADELSHFSVAFSTQLKGNMHRREVHLHENIRMWLGPVQQWNAAVDPSQRSVLGKDDVWMSCHELFVLESPSAATMTDRRPIELLARGEAYVEGQLYAAKGHQIKYAEEKDMMTFEGDARRPAELWQRTSANEQGTSRGRVRRIRFWPKSEKVVLDGLIGFDVSTAPTPQLK